MRYILLSALCSEFLLILSESTLVTTTTGPVNGKFNNVNNVPQYLSYEGIRYAQSPTGDLRFQDPVAVEPWTEVLNATTPTPVCLQEELLYDNSEMSEDCLFLNVYSPDINPPTPKPVMVFLHGGYFLWGSGNRDPMFGPEKIIANDAVCVTLNYRLGLFGFLSLETPEVPGNYGLKDVLLALQWISANIQTFGGDRNNIALAGVEAGAMLAHYLMLTGKSAGLYHKVLLLTGTALSYRALQREPKQIAAKLAHKCGLSTHDTIMMQQLKNSNAFQLLQCQTSLVYDAPDVAYVINGHFMPCIDAGSSNPIIPTHPLDAMKAGAFQNVPVFMGFKTQEGLESFPFIREDDGQNYPSRIEYLNENIDALIPRDIQYPLGSQIRQDLANSIKEYYLGDGNISIFNVQNFINLVTDSANSYSSDLTVELFKQKQNSQVFSHLLELDTDIYWFKVFHNITYPGASCFDSLFFVQPITLPRVAKLDTRKLAVLGLVNSFLYNFLVYGVPSPPGISNTTVSWTETGSERAYIAIGDTAVMIPNPPFQDRVNFWRGVYDEYYQYVGRSAV